MDKEFKAIIEGKNTIVISFNKFEEELKKHVYELTFAEWKELWKYAIRVFNDNGYILTIVLENFKNIITDREQENLVEKFPGNWKKELSELLNERSLGIFKEMLRCYSLFYNTSAQFYENMVKDLISFGANINVKDINGNTLLHDNSSYANIPRVEFLIKVGADLNAKNNNGDTALHIATEKGNFDAVKVLVDNGADVNKSDINNNAALHIAAKNNNFYIVKNLVNNGADVNKIDIHGTTALHNAACHDSSAVVTYLVEHEANIDMQNQYGLTPLTLAILNGNFDVANYLINLGADVNKKISYISMLKLKHNIDINKQNEDDTSLLQNASEFGSEYLVKLLVKLGADINARDCNHDTALLLAAENGHTDIVKYLVEHDADINVKNIDCETALLVAAKKGHTNIVKYLVEHGANINVINIHNETALDIAVEKGYTNIAEALLEELANKAKNTVNNGYYNEEITKETRNELVDSINKELAICKEAIESMEPGVNNQFELKNMLQEYSNKKVPLTIKGSIRKVVIEFFEACGSFIKNITKGMNKNDTKEITPNLQNNTVNENIQITQMHRENGNLDKNKNQSIAM